jgi:hypothetical protein
MRVVGRRRGEWGSGAERPGEAGEEEGFREPPHRWGFSRVDDAAGREGQENERGL